MPQLHSHRNDPSLHSLPTLDKVSIVPLPSFLLQHHQHTFKHFFTYNLIIHMNILIQEYIFWFIIDQY